MKKLVAIAAILSVVAASESKAADLGIGFYGAVRGGATKTETMTFAQPSTANLSLNPGTGWVLDGALGYHFSDLLRAEVDAAYGMNNLKGRFQENVATLVACGNTASFPCLSPDVTGDIKTLSAFGMGYVDFPFGALFKAYIGAGIGIVRVDANVQTRASLNNGTVSRFDIIDANISVMAYRGKVGFTIPIVLADVDVGYSYTITNKLSLPGRGANVSFIFDRRMTTHSLTAGVIYRF